MKDENYLKKLADAQTQIKELVPNSLKENGKRKMKTFEINIVGETPLNDEQIGKCLGFLNAFVEYGMNGECEITYTPLDDDYCSVGERR